MSVAWFTIFTDDDVTPLVGRVDASGKIVDPTFSTDIAHPRPWLEKDPQGATATINLIEGTATIAQFALTVIDARTDPTDQRTGYVTGLLALPNGYSAMIMHRAVYMVQGPDGVMYVVQNGVITDITLNADLSSYTFQVRDMNERARKAPLFTKLTGPTPRYTKDQAPERPSGLPGVPDGF